MAGKKKKKPGFLGRVRALFRVRETPGIMAGSVATAVLCGTSPFFVGIPLLPFLVRIFRLNKLVTVGATVILFANPFMILLMVFQLWIGLQILGDTSPPTNLWAAARAIGTIGWKFAGDLFLRFQFNADSLLLMADQSKRYLIAYAVGGYSFSVGSSLAVLGLTWVYLSRKARRTGLNGRRKKWVKS